MDPNTAANLPGLAGNPLWQDEGMVNAIWNGILNHAFGNMTLAAGSFIIAPELFKGQIIADLAVMIVNGDGTFRKPSLCFEGKGGSNSQTLDNAIQQIQDWTKSAVIGTYGSIWGLAAKADVYTFVVLDRKKNDTWYGVVPPVAAGGVPTYQVQPVAYTITRPADITRLGYLLTYILANPNPTLPRP